MPYSVVGLGPRGLEHATRIRASSAVVLASRWERAGFVGVTIKDGDLEPETVERFRRRQFALRRVGQRVAGSSWFSA